LKIWVNPPLHYGKMCTICVNRAGFYQLSVGIKDMGEPAPILCTICVNRAGFYQLSVGIKDMGEPAPILW
ncbi:MAG: hypothetical protein RLZZ338_1043, partial [Cyanobacteriota bacterium]